MNEPYDILKAFGITEASDGAVWFLELVWELAAAWDHGRRIGVMGEITKQWQSKGIHPRAYYAKIRAALAPIIQASGEELAAWGLYPEKRTIPSLAYAVATWMISKPG